MYATFHVGEKSNVLYRVKTLISCWRGGVRFKIKENTLGILGTSICEGTEVEWNWLRWEGKCRVSTTGNEMVAELRLL